MKAGVSEVKQQYQRKTTLKIGNLKVGGKRSKTTIIQVKQQTKIGNLKRGVREVKQQ